MNQEEFYYLCTNVNCLAELGLKELDAPQDVNTTDIDAFMSQAYAHQDIMIKQTNKAYKKADLEELDHSLHLIPKPLPPIQKKMNGQDMQQWKRRFSKCDDNVLSLVAEVALLSVA